MESEEMQIISCLEDLKKVNFHNPRYDYYYNKISILMRQAYAKNTISGKELSRLSDEINKARKGYMNLSVYKVLEEFREFDDNGSNLLSHIKLEWVAPVKDLCRSMLPLNDITNFNLLFSDDNLNDRLMNCVQVCLDLKDKDRDNTKLYSKMNLLKDLCYAARERDTLYDLSKDVIKIYLEIAEELLESDKEFYYRPHEKSYSMKQFNYFSKSDSIDKNDYLDYYINLYWLKGVREDFFPTGNFYEKINQMITDCEQLDLEDDKCKVLQISIRNQFLVKRNPSYTDPIAFLLDNDFLDLVVFDYSLVSRSVLFANNFCEFFTKEMLLEHVVVLADISANNKGGTGIKNILFNEALKSGLKILERSNEITDEEFLYFYNGLRRDLDEQEKNIQRGNS